MKCKTKEWKLVVKQVQLYIFHWKVMRNAGPREKREGCCNTVMPSAAHTLFDAEGLSRYGLSKVGLEIRPQKGRYRATSGTVLGRLGLTRSCPYCASVWNFRDGSSCPPTSGSGGGHPIRGCSAECSRWGPTRCPGHSGWRSGGAPLPGSCDPMPPCGPWSTAAIASQGARPGSVASSAACQPSGPWAEPRDCCLAPFPEAIAVLACEAPRCSNATLLWDIFPRTHRAQDQTALQLPPENVGKLGGVALLLVGVRGHADHVLHSELGLRGHSGSRYRVAALG